MSRIEITKEALNFSIAHFTIFSATNRENLHGHNFQLQCHVTAPLGEDGLIFDYVMLKTLLKQLCDELDEQLILPTASPYLQIEQDDTYVTAIFNGERLPFLKRDVMLLPIANTTVEAFSQFFLEKIRNHPDLQDKGITAITTKVASNVGQYGVAEWSQQ